MSYEKGWGQPKPGCYVLGGSLFFRLLDGSTIHCDCIAGPYAVQVSELFNAKENPMTIEPGDTQAKEIERLARLLCIADLIDPDTTVASYPLAVTNRNLTLVPQGSTGPAWRSYAKLARAIVYQDRGKIELVSADRPVPYANWIRDVKSYAHDLLRPGTSRDSLDEAIRGLKTCFAERVE